MAWKYRRWKIRWQPKERKFKKIQRDRTRSRKAHLRWKKNRGKMKQALRKARIKGRITRRKNKAKGIYKKLGVARKRWKNLIKSDVNLGTLMDMELLSEQHLVEKYGAPELEIEDHDDIEGIIDALEDMKINIDMADYEDEEVKEEYINSAIDKLEDLKDKDELDEDDEDFVEEVISFIEEFAEAIDEIETDDEYSEANEERIDEKWSIKKRGDRWAVVKDDGEVEAYHNTKKEARNHQKALYANTEY